MKNNLKAIFPRGCFFCLVSSYLFEENLAEFSQKTKKIILSKMKTFPYSNFNPFGRVSGAFAPFCF